MLHMHNARVGQPVLREERRPRALTRSRLPTPEGVPPPEAIAEVETSLLLRIDGRVSSRSLGHRGMTSRWKRLPYLTVDHRTQGDDAQGSAASQPNHDLDLRSTVF